MAMPTSMGKWGMKESPIDARLMASSHGDDWVDVSKVVIKSRNMSCDMPQGPREGAYALMKPRERVLGLFCGRMTG